MSMNISLHSCMFVTILTTNSSTGKQYLYTAVAIVLSNESTVSTNNTLFAFHHVVNLVKEAAKRNICVVDVRVH